MQRICSLLIALMLFGFFSEFGPFDRVGTDSDAAGNGVTPQHAAHVVDSHNR